MQISRPFIHNIIFIIVPSERSALQEEQLHTQHQASPTSAVIGSCLCVRSASRSYWLSAPSLARKASVIVKVEQVHFRANV